MVSSMLMFLLHPRTLIKKNRQLYCSFNKLAFDVSLQNRSIMFRGKSTGNSEEFEPYLMAIAQKLVRRGSSMFVRNVAVLHKFKHKKAIHVDMIAFDPKKNKIIDIRKVECRFCNEYRNKHKYVKMIDTYRTLKCLI